jgi:hypothetical protein
LVMSNTITGTYWSPFIPPVWSFRFGIAYVPCSKGRPYADLYLKCANNMCRPSIQDEVHLTIHCSHLPVMPLDHVMPTPSPTPPKEAP